MKKQKVFYLTAIKSLNFKDLSINCHQTKRNFICFFCSATTLQTFTMNEVKSVANIIKMIPALLNLMLCFECLFFLILHLNIWRRFELCRSYFTILKYVLFYEPFIYCLVRPLYNTLCKSVSLSHRYWTILTSTIFFSWQNKTYIKQNPATTMLFPHKRNKMYIFSSPG